MSMPGTALSKPGRNETAAVLRIHELQLQFPQSEIRTLEAASDVDAGAPLPGSIGWINYLRERWPVYCLSEQLALQITVPPERRTCALFAVEQGYIGLLCDDAAIMKQVDGQQPGELPVAMRRQHTPILALAMQDEQMMCVSSAQKMAAYLRHLTEGLV